MDELRQPGRDGAALLHCRRRGHRVAAAASAGARIEAEAEIAATYAVEAPPAS
jgi:hypothetical protein